MSPEDFRKVRNALGLTQLQMGLLTGMQRRTVMRLEQGRGRAPTPEQVAVVQRMHEQEAK